MAKDPVRYWKSNEVRDVARELIEQYHTHLGAESILFIFRSEHAETEGKPIPGVSAKLTGRNAYLVRREYLDDAQEAPGYVLLVEVAHDLWQKMRAEQRVALVDHLLCRFGIDWESGSISLRAPDVVEYREVIDRHGLWRPEVEELAATLAQFKLFPAGEDGGDPAALNEAFVRSRGVGLTPDQIGALRAAAERTARELMKKALREKRTPSPEEYVTVAGTEKPFAEIRLRDEQSEAAAQFFVAEVGRFIEQKWDEFRAMKGHAASVVESLVDEASNPDSKTAKALRPKKGSGVSSVTISNGEKSVTLEARD